MPTDVGMNGADPFWKRSGFGQIILYVVSVTAWWFFDGVAIGSEQVITFTTMCLLLLGYQTKRPTGRVT